MAALWHVILGEFMRWFARDDMPVVGADVFDVVKGTRELTELERRYAEGFLHRVAGARLFVLMVLICLIFSLGMLIWLFIFDANPDYAGFNLVFFLLCAAFIAICGWLWVRVWRRRCVLSPSASILYGVLEVASATVANPSIGAVARSRTYRLGPADVRWPLGAESLYQSHVGETVEITAALLTRSKPLAFGGRGSVLTEQATLAVVLTFRDSIRIHHAIARYGNNMFVLHVLKTMLGGFAIMGVFGLALWLLWDHLDTMGGWWSLAAMIALFLATALASAFAWICFLVPLVVRWGMDTTPHTERLRG